MRHANQSELKSAKLEQSSTRQDRVDGLRFFKISNEAFESMEAGIFGVGNEKRKREREMERE